LTKHVSDHLHEDNLKIPIDIDDIKVDVLPKIINPTMALSTPNGSGKPKKMKNRMVKSRMVTKKTRLEKATSNLYDLEDCSGPEKTLNIDFGLYQMEEY
jgi:hypothetical protein